MIAVMVAAAVFALVVSLAVIARPTEFDQARPHEGASMREERADRYAALCEQEEAARPDATVLRFPTHGETA